MPGTVSDVTSTSPLVTLVAVAMIDFESAKALTASSFSAQIQQGAADRSGTALVLGIGDGGAVLTFAYGGMSILVLTGKTTIDIAGGATTSLALQSLAKKILAG